MMKKYERQIQELLALGRRDLEQNGMISIRETIVLDDGNEITVPPPGTGGISLNLDCDSARMCRKKMMWMRLKDNPAIEAIFFLHYRVIYALEDLVKHPNRLSLYVLGVTAEESIFVRQDYTLDHSKKLVFGELTVLDHDSEEAFLDHGFLAEQALSMPDEMFAKVPEDMLVESFPKEWLEYIHRERQNRDEDEWYSPKRATESSITDKKEGGSHEVPAAEETV
jgi:hypothetical protein